ARCTDSGAWLLRGPLVGSGSAVPQKRRQMQVCAERIPWLHGVAPSRQPPAGAVGRTPRRRRPCRPGPAFQEGHNGRGVLAEPSPVVVVPALLPLGQGVAELSLAAGVLVLLPEARAVLLAPESGPAAVESLLEACRQGEVAAKPPKHQNRARTPLR